MEVGGFDGWEQGGKAMIQLHSASRKETSIAYYHGEAEIPYCIGPSCFQIAYFPPIGGPLIGYIMVYSKFPTERILSPKTLTTSC
jgi:hypothetical protein